MFQADFAIIPPVYLKSVHFYVCNFPIINIFEICLKHYKGLVNLGKGS